MTDWLDGIREEITASRDDLPSESFEFGLYDSACWTRLGIDMFAAPEILRRAAFERIVGWCDASRLSVRPKSGTVAIMCRDDDCDLFWFHL